MDPLLILGGLATIIGAIAGLIEIVKFVDERKTSRAEKVAADATTLSEKSSPAPEYPPQPAPQLSFQPAPPRKFVGRDAELERLSQLINPISQSVLVALQGMGGIGKTTLTSQLVEEVKQQFAGGVFWAQMGLKPDVYGILGRWSHQAGRNVTEYNDLQAKAAAVRSFLALRGSFLVVLDDVWDYETARVFIEQVVPPHVTVLLTTRDADLAKRLHCQVVEIAVISEADALKLLADHLGPLGAFEQEAKDVARLVGYLPLALELVAGIADAPADLGAVAGHLRTKPTLGVLKMGSGDYRNESVEASLALSYQSLEAEMQRRFRLLGAFALAPFEMAAVEAVWGEHGVEALRFLVRRAFVTRREGDDYAQHMLLHAYAATLLQQSDEERLARQRHAAYYQSVAQSGNWHMVDKAFEQVRQGWETLKEWRDEKLFDYLDAVYPYLDIRGRWAEYLEWAGFAYSLAHEKGRLDVVARLCAGMGYVSWQAAKYEQALAYLNEGLKVAQASGNQDMEARCLNNLGLVYRSQLQFDTALDFFQQSLAMRQQLGHRLGGAFARHNIGLIYLYRGDAGQALDYLNRGLEDFDQLSNQRGLDLEENVSVAEGQAITRNTIGRVYISQGQYDQALGVWQEGLAIAVKSGNRSSECRLTHNIGRYDLLQNRLPEAGQRFQASLQIAREIGHRRAEARALSSLGEVSCLQGEYAQALDFYGQCLAIHQSLGARPDESFVLRNMARVYQLQGQADRALSNSQDSLDIARQIDYPIGLGIALWQIAEIQAAHGQAQAAQTAQAEANELFQKLGLASIEEARLVEARRLPG